MAIKRMSKYLEILFGLGVLCLLYALGSIYLEQMSNTFTNGLLVVGTISILICLYVVKGESPKATEVLRFKRFVTISGYCDHFYTIYYFIKLCRNQSGDSMGLNQIQATYIIRRY